MIPDPWLEQWLPLIARYCNDSIILELGCGDGADTVCLNRAGHRVVALDLSAESIATAKTRVPSAAFHHQDIRAPFPILKGSAGVIVASLSLHYFEWTETMDLVARIRQTLRKPGLFLCRLNSTNDHNFGASGHPRISENYYCVKDRPKRFFDRGSVLKLFANDWCILSMEERLTHKYHQPKVLWEVILETDTMTV